jgi:hypothetical protein
LTVTAKRAFVYQHPVPCRFEALAIPKATSFCCGALKMIRRSPTRRRRLV